MRGEDGRDWLAETLQAHGAQVDFVAAYRRCPPRPDAVQTALLQRALVAPADHLWLFSSSQAVAHLQALAGGGTGAWQAARAVASHPRIANWRRGRRASAACSWRRRRRPRWRPWRGNGRR